jgi:pyruvate dehydrogenase E2 component (dihydrolipoamide acetyltransferase)
MPVAVKMPKWGLMMKAGTVTEWLRAEGDAVSAGDPLFVVETDKAINDVEAPGDGVLRRIVAGAGTEVTVSGPVGVICAVGEMISDDAVDAFVAAQAPAPAPASARERRPARAPRAAERGDDGRIVASPAARKRARELGIDLATVTATGAGGRITSEDVEAAATEIDPDVREEWLTLDDGSRIYSQSAGPPAAPAVVFVHGIGGSSATWQGVIGAFVEAHHVVAIDLPGHGQSDVPASPTTDYDLDGLARTMIGALDRLGLERFTLVGHSLGGAIALAAALAVPDRVTRLMLVDSSGLGAEINPDLLRLLDEPPSLVGSRALLELFFDDQRFVLDAGVAEHHTALSRPGAHAAVRAIRDAAFGETSQRRLPSEWLARITQPVQVVWGDRDRVIPAAHAEHARAAIADVEVAIIPDAGHAPQVEQPAAFTAILARFLAGGEV